MEPRLARSEPAPGDGAPTAETQQLESFLTHIPLGVLVVDAMSGRVLRANAEARRLLAGAAPSEASRTYRGFDAHGREYEPHEWPLSRTLANDEIVRGETIRHVFGDGSERVISVTTAPVRRGDQTTAAIVVLDDVTAQELRSRADRDFITNAAHELQTPIAAITSAVDVLQRGAKERPEDRNRFLEHIETAVDRLSRLTRALLVLARAEGAEPPRREVLPLAPLLAELAERLPGPLTIECPQDLAVISNRVLLDQALLNLIDNAFKHAQTKVTVAAAARGDRVVIDVRDTGRGIDAAIRERVFDRFIRAGATGGFGLGLAIARDAVAASGGELQLETTPRGTCVSVILEGATVRAQ